MYTALQAVAEWLRSGLSPYRRLSAVGDTKFRDDTAHVLLYRAHADEELSGYLLVRVSSRYQPKHLPLTN